MRTTLTVLSALLVAQLGLAAALNWGSPESADMAQGSLFNFDTEAVEAIQITDAEGDALKIEQTEEGWTLPGADGFPASEAKVDRLLNQAHGFDSRLPVARSQASQSRFSVASDKFKRRIQFMVDGQPRATLLLGDSAGSGRVYARAADQNMIYEVDFSLQYASADASNWLDRSVAAVAKDKVRKIIFPGFTLHRAEKGNGWKVARSGEKGEAKAKLSAIKRWLGQLTQPDFNGVTKTEPPKREPKLAYTLVTKQGDRIRFAYYKPGDNSKSTSLYREGQPWLYRVSKSYLSRLSKLDGKQFVAHSQEDSKKDEQDSTNKGKNPGSHSSAETGQGKISSSKRTGHAGK